ncbi:lymphotoxin-beta [Ctenodactylus gundi]
MKAPLPWPWGRVWMRAQGLQSGGGRPRGRGCLLLAVAGATSLATLLLAVPITVLAVLALVPQDQGGQGVPAFTCTTDTFFMEGPRLPNPGKREHVWVGGFQKQREEPPGHRIPAAHLIGAWTKGRGLGWEAHQEEAFLRSGARFSGATGLALPLDGLYYLYCHVGYRGRARPAGGSPPGPLLTLRSSLYRVGGAYGEGAPELLLEGAETVTPVLERASRPEYAPLWYTSVGFGGLVQLRRGERVFVNISHPDMVDYRRGKTFFGAVMVG